MAFPISVRDTAFAVGNGSSRIAIELDDLKTYGLVGACNFIYRDRGDGRPYLPDILLAVDIKPERLRPVPAIRKDLPAVGATILPEGKTRRTPYFGCLEGRWRVRDYGWASGPSLGTVFYTLGVKTVYLLGMDGGGHHVDGTKTRHGKNFTRNWGDVFKMSLGKTEWVWVAPVDWPTPEAWMKCENLSRTSVRAWAGETEPIWPTPFTHELDTRLSDEEVVLMEAAR
jgi:hypothetical protein